MSGGWDGIADWWRREGTTDPSYRNDVIPLLADLVPTGPSSDDVTVLDLGCGDGHLGTHLPGRVVGVDGSEALARAAVERMPTVVARSPNVRCFRPGSFGGIASVYLLDLVEDAAAFFDDTRRLVADHGWLAVVINHPVYTAPGSVPILDLDGEPLWRWGRYFDDGTSIEPAGPGAVRYRHRSVASLVTAAAGAGWVLDRLVERPLSPATVAALPGYAGQDSVPRFLGGRWTAGPVRFGRGTGR